MEFHFTSPVAFEKWDYRNPLNPGIGGSETAHIEMALRLAKRGHKVISYSPLPKDIPDRNYGGVAWRDVLDMNPNDPGIWVVYRRPSVVDVFPKQTKDQKIWLVMQDVDYPDLDEKRRVKFDRILPICSVHKNYTIKKHKDYEDIVFQSANGIRTDMIKEVEQELKSLNGHGIKRDKKRLMYASSPDRGLVPLLRIFQKAHDIDPELSLYIFYGFDNISKYREPNKPFDPHGNTEARVMEMAKQPGVHWMGRRGQRELYKEWFKTGIWCYPTNFTETGCITSMDAMACGALPITNDLWALLDNVKSGIRIEGDCYADALTQCRYANAIVEMANSDWEETRVEMMKDARERFDWEKVVDQYEAFAKLN